MSESKALVGPLKLLRFGMNGEFKIAYDVPRDTMDPRYPLCFNHRTACDCREAELHEALSEHRAETKSWVDAARTVLVGHRSWDWGDDGDSHPYYSRGDGPLACKCHGCQIVRAARASVYILGGDYDTGIIQPPDGKS